MSLLSAFHQQVRSAGLRLPTVDGGVGLPGAALYRSPVYNAVADSSERIKRYEAAARAGRSVNGQRVDAARKNVAADARLAGVLAEHADQLHRHWSRNPGGRMDSVDDLGRDLAARVDSLVPMGSQGLTSFLPEVYDFQHAALTAWNGDILKIDRTSVDRAAENFVWYERDLVGVAKVSNSYSTMDIPMVVGPVSPGMNLGRIVPALVGMETNFMDDRRSALGVANGKPDFQLQQGKVQMCNEALAQFANALWLYGDATLGIDGLQNHPLVATISLTSGAWSAATAAQINADLVTILNTIPNAAQGAIGPGGGISGYSKIKIMLPFAQYQRAANLIVSSAGDKSVLKFFMENNGLRDDQVVQVWDFSAANSQIYTGGPFGLSADRGVVIYEAGDGWDPKFMLPQPIEMPAAPRQNGLSETTFYHMRVGGMMVADARRIRYIEGF